MKTRKNNFDKRSSKTASRMLLLKDYKLAKQVKLNRKKLLPALAYIVLAAMSIHAIAQPGTVLTHQKISDVQSFTGGLQAADHFGNAVTSIGDLDGDGITDLAVGTLDDDGGGYDRGAVWILFLNQDGTVKAHQKISDTQGNFTGILDDADRFGCAVALLGDIDGDQVADIAVGARFDDDGAGGNNNRGAIWILFLNTNGTVKSHQKISDKQGSFKGLLDDYDLFGTSVCSIGDLDGDGITEIAVGAENDDDGSVNNGAVWVLFLNIDGTVRTYQKISSSAGNFSGTLDDHDLFGNSLTPLGDLDGDGINDIAAGAYQDDDGGYNRGAVWILFLNPDGTVKSHQKISDAQGNFQGIIDNVDGFGYSLTTLSDLNNDGISDIAASALQDDDNIEGSSSQGINKGAVWILFLNSDGTIKDHQKISNTAGNFTGTLDNNDFLGWSVTSLGDLDGNQVPDIAVGAYADDDGGTDKGALWILFLDYSVVLDIVLRSFSASPADPGTVLLLQYLFQPHI